MRKQQIDLGQTEKKKGSRWPFVLLDIWLLIGLIIGYNTHDYRAIPRKWLKLNGKCNI